MPVPGSGSRFAVLKNRELIVNRVPNSVFILILIGTLASWIPSRRALKINPAMVLRTT